MRHALALIGLGVLALIVQGALAAIIPTPLTPDLGLLVVVAIGLCWRGTASGFAIAALLGFAADLLSASLLGQHALLRLLAFGAARLASGQLNLRGPIPLAVFAGGLTVAYGAGVLALSGFFTGAWDWSFGWLVSLLQHAFANAVCAPGCLALVAAVSARLGEGEAGRRPLPLEARGRSA